MNTLPSGNMAGLRNTILYGTEPSGRFDGYCWYTRLATLNVFDGVDGEHSVEIEVLAEQPERKLLKKEIDTACEKYDGTWFQPCQIMLIGDIVR